jgi:hypothetical protein
MLRLKYTYSILQPCCNKGRAENLKKRVGIILIYVIMQIKKEALISQILAEKSANPVGGTHCSNCGHCSSTL